MTETEYILASDQAKASAAEHLLRDTMAAPGDVDSKVRIDAARLVAVVAVAEFVNALTCAIEIDEPTA